MVTDTMSAGGMLNQPISIHQLLEDLHVLVQYGFLAMLWNHVDYQEVQHYNQ